MPRQRLGSGPGAHERRCPLLGVPSEPLIVVGGKLTGFALCWQRMWPTPSQQSRLDEQQRKLWLLKQKCHQGQERQPSMAQVAEVAARHLCRGVSALCVRSWALTGRVKGAFLAMLPAPGLRRMICFSAWSTFPIVYFPGGHPGGESPRVNLGSTPVPGAAASMGSSWDCFLVRILGPSRSF